MALQRAKIVRYIQAMYNEEIGNNKAKDFFPKNQIHFQGKDHVPKKVINCLTFIIFVYDSENYRSAEHSLLGLYYYYYPLRTEGVREELLLVLV